MATVVYPSMVSFHFSLHIFNIFSVSIYKAWISNSERFPALQISIKWKFVFGTGAFRTTNQAGVQKKNDMLKH